MLRNLYKLISAFLLCAGLTSGILMTAYADPGYEIALGIRADTDSSIPVMPRSDVHYRLYIDNLKGPAWIRIYTSVSSSGINDSFTTDCLKLNDGWIRKGNYCYLKSKAAPASSILAIDGFRVPDSDHSENASLTISARAEAIDIRSVTPDFDLDDPWKGNTPDTVTEFRDIKSSSSGGSGGSSRNSSRSSSSGLKRYAAPEAKADCSSGNWYCIDKDKKLWKYGSDKYGYAKDGWYYIYNSYAGNGGKTQWFYFDSSEYMQTGWSYPAAQKNWYHLNELSDGSLGALSTGWYSDAQDKKRYYLDPVTGVMYTGWQLIDGRSYYFAALKDIPGPTWIYKLLQGTGIGKWIYNSVSQRSLGSMYINETTPDGNRVDTNGVMIKK